MTCVRAEWVGLLLLAFGCGSSSGAAPIDPVATAYCAACSEFPNCERVVNQTINVNCTDETRAWYSCATENACDSTACEAEGDQREICMRDSPADLVRDRIGLLTPSANLGHRGTGPTRAGHPFPENSISSFVAAIDAGADGVSLDVEITLDGQLIVMHDDTLDRTTNCTGCVSAMTFDEIRACRLLDGAGAVTDERPPTLPEVYAAIGGNAIMDVELKVFGSECLTDTTGPEQLVAAVLDEITLIGGEDRTIFSSFDETVAELVKTARPGYYSALLSSNPDLELVETALRLEQDAIHPLFSIRAETVQAALDAGLQVNVWTVNTTEFMRAQLDKGTTAIITDDPAVLAELLGR
jgi:glycerophosphoryl diester phosphodiesterase